MEQYILEEEFDIIDEGVRILLYSKGKERLSDKNSLRNLTSCSLPQGLLLKFRCNLLIALIACKETRVKKSYLGSRSYNNC